MTLSILLLLILLFTKHHLADFVYQPPYQWQNKGTYGHMGGIVHAGQHVLLSLIILLFYTTPVIAIGIALIEGIVHYHMDWFKMWWGKRKGLTPLMPKFWLWLGNDQWVHSTTYLIMAFAIAQL